MVASSDCLGFNTLSVTSLISLAVVQKPFSYWHNAGLRLLMGALRSSSQARLHAPHRRPLVTLAEWLALRRSVRPRTNLAETRPSS